MKLPSTLTCLTLLASTASAQQIQISSAERSYSVWASGYDYEYDEYDGREQVEQDLYGPWLVDDSLVLIDYDGVEVSRANAFHDSLLSQRGVLASLQLTASSQSAPYFRTDAGGNQQLHVDFGVPSRLRYRLELDLTTSLPGYSVAMAFMSGPQGQLFNQRVFQGSGFTIQESGWLQVGAHSIDVELDAGILLTHGQSETCSTGCELDFRTYHAADYNLDDKVDRVDESLFTQAYLAGNPAADINADGSVDSLDRTTYLRAWFKEVLPKRRPRR